MIKANALWYRGEEISINAIAEYPKDIDKQWRYEIKHYPALQQVYNFVVYRHFVETLIMKGIKL